MKHQIPHDFLAEDLSYLAASSHLSGPWRNRIFFLRFGALKLRNLAIQHFLLDFRFILFFSNLNGSFNYGLQHGEFTLKP